MNTASIWAKLTPAMGPMDATKIPPTLTPLYDAVQRLTRRSILTIRKQAKSL